MVDDVVKTIRYVVAILVLIAAGCGDNSTIAVARRNACIGNLGELEGVKSMWYRDEKKTTNEVPTMADLAKYMRKIPKCPSGWTYTLGTFSQMATCTVKGHAIP